MTFSLNNSPFALMVQGLRPQSTYTSDVSKEKPKQKTDSLPHWIDYLNADAVPTK